MLRIHSFLLSAIVPLATCWLAPAACTSMPDDTPNDVDGGDASAHDAASDGCVPHMAGSLVCNAFTIGKGPSCDACVESHCAPAGSECCNRGAACSNPDYEYRVLIASCIADQCGTECGVACEDWRTGP